MDGRVAGHSFVSVGRDGREAGGAHVEPFHLAGKGDTRWTDGGGTNGDAAFVAIATRVGSG